MRFDSELIACWFISFSYGHGQDFAVVIVAFLFMRNYIIKQLLTIEALDMM